MGKKEVTKKLAEPFLKEMEPLVAESIFSSHPYIIFLSKAPSKEVIEAVISLKEGEFSDSLTFKASPKKFNEGRLRPYVEAYRISNRHNSGIFNDMSRKDIKNKILTEVKKLEEETRKFLFDKNTN